MIHIDWHHSVGRKRSLTVTILNTKEPFLSDGMMGAKALIEENKQGTSFIITPAFTCDLSYVAEAASQFQDDIIEPLCRHANEVWGFVSKAMYGTATKGCFDIYTDVIERNEAVVIHIQTIEATENAEKELALMQNSECFTDEQIKHFEHCFKQCHNAICVGCPHFNLEHITHWRLWLHQGRPHKTQYGYSRMDYVDSQEKTNDHN